jgi:hypothetical protein
MPLIEHLKKGNFAKRRLPLLTCNWQSIEFVSLVQVPEPPATQGAPDQLKVLTMMTGKLNQTFDLTAYNGQHEACP